MSNNLTIHIVNTIPWSNLNRNEHGIPKSFTQGGVERGQLSSQSLKRAARINYEGKSLGIGSVRSANLVTAVLDAAKRIEPELDEKLAEKLAKKYIGTLTKADKGKDEGKDEKGRSAWLSSEEIEACANLIVQKSDNGNFIESGRTGSLSIAAFGRMFANAPGMGTEAAISVSPAVSTHEAIIEIDYFSTVDDNPKASQGAGSSYLGVANYTNGIFYRTVTIDRAQLRKSWTGIDSEDSEENLKALIRSIIYKLPRGKVKGTAPEVMPQLVLIEEQEYRFAYEFEKPVEFADGGGYLAPTVERLAEQRRAALAFDPDNFGETSGIGGTANPELLEKFNLPVRNLSELIASIVEWIKQ